jgi:hypothetical protein
MIKHSSKSFYDPIVATLPIRSDLYTDDFVCKTDSDQKGEFARAADGILCAYIAPLHKTERIWPQRLSCPATSLFNLKSGLPEWTVSLESKDLSTDKYFILVDSAAFQETWSPVFSPEEITADDRESSRRESADLKVMSTEDLFARLDELRDACASNTLSAEVSCQEIRAIEKELDLREFDDPNSKSMLSKIQSDIDRLNKMGQVLKLMDEILR